MIFGAAGTGQPEDGAGGTKSEALVDLGKQGQFVYRFNNDIDNKC